MTSECAHTQQPLRLVRPSPPVSRIGEKILIADWFVVSVTNEILY